MSEFEIFQMVISVHTLVISTLVMATGFVSMVYLICDKKKGNKK